MTETLKEGVRLWNDGDLERALSVLEQVDPLREPEAAYYLALTSSKLGRPEAALRSLDLVLVHETNFLKIVQAKMVRALLLTSEHRYVEAEAALRTMIEEGIESVQVYSNYGYVLWALDRSSEGVVWLNKAVGKEPNNRNALNSLGYLLAEQGVLLDKALTVARKALTLQPGHPAYLDSVGWIYHKMGLHKQALTYLQKAANADPESLEIRIHLVEAERALGLQASSPGGKR